MSTSGIAVPGLDLAEISGRLHPTKVGITDLLLDPNNPRLAEIRGAREPEEGIDEEEVQRDTFRRLKDEVGIDDLRSSIATVGFLPIAMLVVRRHFEPDSGKYVVIEGNRRIAAIKWILEEAPPGIEGDVLRDRRAQLKQLDVIELDTDSQRLENDRFLLQGIVHLSPIRSWPAYARALACYTLDLRGLKATEISRALGGGISAIEVGRLLRAHYAYVQMTEDEEFADYAATRRQLLSYFSEVIGRPSLREWLEWNDNERLFMHDERRKDLYELLVSKKIRRLTDIRYLPKILEYSVLSLDRLVAEEDYDVEEAYADALRAEQSQRAPPVIPWRSRLRDALRVLFSGIALPFNEDDIELLKNVRDLADKRLHEVQRYLGFKEE